MNRPLLASRRVPTENHWYWQKPVLLPMVPFTAASLMYSGSNASTSMQWCLTHHVKAASSTGMLSIQSACQAFLQCSSTTLVRKELQQLRGLEDPVNLDINLSFFSLSSVIIVRLSTNKHQARDYSALEAKSESLHRLSCVASSRLAACLPRTSKHASSHLPLRCRRTALPSIARNRFYNVTRLSYRMSCARLIGLEIPCSSKMMICLQMLHIHTSRRKVIHALWGQSGKRHLRGMF